MIRTGTRCSVRAVRQLADDALARRIPPVRPDELRNPMGPAEEAAARATNNARWWSGLTDEQRSALIETYPQDIGNAEGIRAADRDSANRNVLQQMRDQADAVRSKADRGERLTGAERKLLRRMDKLDLALRKAAVDAEQAGVDGPLLLAFDPIRVRRRRARRAQLRRRPVHRGFGVLARAGCRHHGGHAARIQHHLRTASPAGRSAREPGPVGGIDRLDRIRRARAAGAPCGPPGHSMARTGGDILYSDITAFNAARDTLAGDGSHFTGNHVFGYSYGSTTAGYAGQNGRLAGHVRTVSLVGSPGAGPVRTAGEFGIGADNVFVASSSRDVVTALGGRTSASNGRVLGIGLGTDPAMDSFGAVRVTAEPPAIHEPSDHGRHPSRLLPEHGGDDKPRARRRRASRIAVTTEQHRTELGRSRQHAGAAHGRTRRGSCGRQAFLERAVASAAQLRRHRHRRVVLAVRPELRSGRHPVAARCAGAGAVPGGRRRCSDSRRTTRSRPHCWVIRRCGWPY